jgi:septal ring factor EnvC (AmiA/AmiB activator)
MSDITPPVGNEPSPVDDPKGQEPKGQQDDPKPNDTETSPNSEAAKYRRKLRESEAANAELQTKLEELENSKLSAEEKQTKAQAKFQQELAEAKREAADANRKLLSSKAVLKHSLPECLSEMLQGKDEDEVDDHAKSIAAELDKWARGKYKPTAPDLEGGNRNNGNGINAKEFEAQHSQVIASRW